MRLSEERGARSEERGARSEATTVVCIVLSLPSLPALASPLILTLFAIRFARCRFSAVEGIEFGLFGLCSTLALVMFSLLEEDGGELSPSMYFMIGLFIFSIVFLIFVILYDTIVRPMLWGATGTANERGGEVRGSEDRRSAATTVY